MRSLIAILAVGTLITARSGEGQRPDRQQRLATPSAPAGMCRIWLDGVQADSQPAPTDCPRALRDRPPNARVIFGKQGDQRSLPRNPLPDTSRPDDPRQRRPDRKKPEKPGKPDKPNGRGGDRR